MTIKSTVAIDLVDRDRYPLAQVYAKQDDSLSRAIAASIYAAGVAWVPPSGATAVIRYRRPDGIGGIYDELPDGSVAYTIADNVITAYIAPDALSCPGRVRMDIVIVNGTEALATFDISVLVDAAPTSGVAPTNGYYKYKTLADINAALAARVQSVNNQAPDNKGNVQINAEQTGAVSRTAFDAAMTTVVRKVNGVTPDSDGNVNVSAESGGNVLSVNSQTGAVQIPTPASGVCSIGADIPAKVVESVSPGASPVEGAIVYVKFEAANTAENPTLTFMGYTATIVDDEGTAVAPGAITTGTHGFQRRGEAWVLLDGSGAAGEDGGYYAPSVDSGGNLTWTASKSGMPQVSGANIKGPKGDAGVGIASIARTSGTGASGTTDTYTITLTDGSTSTFTVYNGKDGASGSGTETTTHGIVWGLVNVTSSNNVVSVPDGASLVAVLTPADGYTLGDVTITMGGEVVTGAWNADTATVAIQSVTGDVMISCAGVEQTGPVDTSPVIAQSDVGYNGSGEVKSFPGVAITKYYEFTPDIDGIKASGYYDETNDYTTLVGLTGAVAVYTPNTKMVEAGYSTSGMTANASKTALFRDGVFAATMSNACLTGNNTQVTLHFARHNTNAMYANSIAFTISELDADDSYAYWTTVNHTVFPVGVRAGDIIFAGKNTPYYGMANIDGTMLGGEAATALSLDDDIAQDYGAATLSLTPDLSADTSTAYGLSSAYASVLGTIRNEWMVEYNGNANKIPIIIHTDQHGRMTNGGNVKGLFNTIGKAFSLHDISKVMNLGDTVSVEWQDADAEHPLLSCTALENYLSTVEAIPFSKRLEVFGNHDTWYYNGYNDEGNAVGTRYPSTQNHLYKYFRNIYKKSNGNNTGYFAVYDDYFNVKYVVVSAYEYQNGTISNRMTAEQIEWIIREFGKDDGYDIVVVSHCPLYWDDVTGTFPEGAPTTTETLRIADDWIDALWAGRKNKTSGTVNDSDGGSHTFDFTGCTSNLLCALHGHTHRAGYNYVSDSLLSVAFDWFANESMYFCLIDRENRELKVWKFIGSDGDAPEYLTWVAPFDKQ